MLSDKKYVECPLSGCGGNLLAKFNVKQNNTEEEEEQFQYDPAEDTGCRLSPSENKFTVTETGQTRVISGYETKEYRATWLVEYKDEKGRKDKNTLNIVFWNTTPTAAIEEVWAINEEATRAYRKGVKKDANPLSLLLSDKLFDALSAFSGDTSKQNKQWNNSVSQKLAIAKGYPISIKVDWYLDRKACLETQEKTEKKSFDWANPLGAAKEFAKKKCKVCLHLILMSRYFTMFMKLTVLPFSRCMTVFLKFRKAISWSPESNASQNLDILYMI